MEERGLIASQKPRDTFYFVLCSLFLLGVGFMLPFNSLVGAVDWLSHLSPQGHLSFIVTLIYQSTNSLLMLVNLLLGNPFPTFLRLLIGYIILSGILFGAAFTRSATLFCVCAGVTGLGDSILQSAVYGFSARFPSVYTVALVAANSLAGVVSSAIRIITKLAFPQGHHGETRSLEISTFLYFIISGTLLAGCVCVVLILPRLKFVRYYTQSEKMISNEITDDPPALKESEHVAIYQNEPVEGKPDSGNAVSQSDERPGSAETNESAPAEQADIASSSPSASPAPPLVIETHSPAPPSPSCEHTHITNTPPDSPNLSTSTHARPHTHMRSDTPSEAPPHPHNEGMPLLTSLRSPARCCALQRTPVWSVFKQIKYFAGAIFGAFCCSILIFPSIIALLKPSTALTAHLSHGWFPILLIATYNTTDFLVRFLPPLLRIPCLTSGPALFTFASARFLIFVPAFVTLQRRLADHWALDLASFLAVALLGTTQGYLASVGMVEAPLRLRTQEERDTCGTILAFSTAFGLVTGSAISFGVGQLLLMKT